ncbi:MAG: hypothetical protein M1375_00455 [Candidatus Thermoplasmatota archaeon]|nr:hypothetical protein [Candidatus Thermoplasmatota archaeon]MCL5790433.1 hypothetical protein [Candidatus Thermoplasmatota archaeon]
MNHNTVVVSAFFLVSVISGIVSDILLTIFLRGYEATTQGQLEATYGSPVYAAGIASGIFTILLLFYPVFKKGDRSHEWEDFR